MDLTPIHIKALQLYSQGTKTDAPATLVFEDGTEIESGQQITAEQANKTLKEIRGASGATAQPAVYYLEQRTLVFTGLDGVTLAVRV